MPGLCRLALRWPGVSLPTHDRLLQVVEGRHHAQVSNQDFLRAFDEKSPGGIGISALHSFLDLVQRDVVTAQFVGIDEYLILFALTTDDGNLGDTFDRQQAWPDRPVGEGA